LYPNQQVIFKLSIENHKKTINDLIIDFNYKKGRKIMQKDELIQLHSFLLQLKIHLEGMVENNGGSEFISYDKLNITPFQVYKSKREHKLAVFTLSKGIADLLSNNKYPGLEKVSNRLEQMSERFMTEKEKHIINS
jgi:hypothetical protein